MKGLINIKNNDDECFRWCHIHHLNPIEKKNTHTKKITTKDRELVKKLDYSDVSSPVTIKQVGKVEKQIAIRISVYGYSNGKCYPIRVSSEKYEDHTELLLIEEGNTPQEDSPNHFVYIKDFNKLMFAFSKH